MHGIGNELAAAIGENVHHLDGFDGPKGDGGTDDKEAAEKSDDAKDDEGQIENFAQGPMNIEGVEGDDENHCALGYVSETA